MRVPSRSFDCHVIGKSSVVTASVCTMFHYFFGFWASLDFYGPWPFGLPATPVLCVVRFFGFVFDLAGALSVFGMTVVDWMLDWWLASIEVQVDLRTFVDDWGVLFREQNAFGRVWSAMEDFTGQKDLAIDMTKTRLWSTDAEARKAFRQSQVCVTLAARNLGAHQNFSRHSQRRAPEALDAYASGVGALES